jgi:hypothetical protein
MRTLLSKILLFCLLPVCAMAENAVYTILSIAEVTGKHPIRVDGDLRQDCPKRLAVKLRVSQEVSPKDLIARAYFYDRNKKLIYSYKKPCVSELGMSTYGRYGFPNLIPDNIPFDVYFPVTPEIQKAFPSTVLIVFGDEMSVCVKVKGSANPADFAFPEKSKIIAMKK